MSIKGISKSQFIRGSQCPLNLWFYRNRKDLIPEVDPETQETFDVGNEIGELAQQYFGDGELITNKYWDIDGGIDSTNKCIEAGAEIIFEATARHPVDGSYSRIDILKKLPSGKWLLIEVKSTTKVKDTHFEDVGFQYHVFNGAGFEIDQCYLMHVYNEYERDGDLNIKELFILEEITECVQDRQEIISQQIAQLTESASQSISPKETIGHKCFSPYQCDFYHHCWKGVPEYSIFNVISKKKAEEVYSLTNSYEIQDIPEHYLPSGNKRLEINCFLNQQEIYEKELVDDFLSELQYPIHFLDYETISDAVPMFDKSRPYQQIPFQYSLHVIEQPGGKIKHKEFLHQETSDPRLPFILSLIEMIHLSGSILVWNQSFEKACNTGLADAFEEYADALHGINDRIVDLMLPFQKRWVYSSKQRGSHSIKAVLPAYFDKSYQDLNIQSGGIASLYYKHFHKSKFDGDLNSLWSDLYEYCKQDTQSMVDIFQFLENSK